MYISLKYKRSRFNFSTLALLDRFLTGRLNRRVARNLSILLSRYVMHSFTFTSRIWPLYKIKDTRTWGLSILLLVSFVLALRCFTATEAGFESRDIHQDAVMNTTFYRHLTTMVNRSLGNSFSGPRPPWAFLSTTFCERRHFLRILMRSFSHFSELRDLRGAIKRIRGSKHRSRRMRTARKSPVSQGE